MTPGLREEIRGIAADPGRPEVAFYCGRRNYFMGKWIRHAMPPGAIMRFFRPDRLRFERLAHPIPVIEGTHGYLREMFDHYTFSKGMTDWFAKHNGYSHFEAIEGVKLLESKRYTWKSLFARDRYERRMALKELSFRMPMRPLLKFVWMYVLKRGFLDGRAGFTYCRLQAMYECMIPQGPPGPVRSRKGSTPLGFPGLTRAFGASAPPRRPPAPRRPGRARTGSRC